VTPADIELCERAADRELLERAARAAGIPGAFNEAGTFWIAEHLRGDSDEARERRRQLGLQHGRIWWDALNDDGDALRLSVALSMSIELNEEDCPDRVRCLGVHPITFIVGCADEPLGVDDLAATRRAIVRAAAEMAP